MNKKRKITPAKRICPYRGCHFNALCQIFNTNKKVTITKWIEENGACMLAITRQEEAEGVAGMRRRATQKEVAQTYQVQENAVQEAVGRVLKKARKIIENGEIDLDLSEFFD